ncbi:MAG: DUF2332 domain-containing protein [Actinomycetes bacterium]
MDALLDEVAAYYRHFAARELRGSSPTYERIAVAIAQDPDAVAVIAGFPVVKRQVNLVLTALRVDGAPVEDPTGAARHLVDRAEAIGALVRVRSTQTNEARRIGTLLPEILREPGPVALIEVGASAGLCLHPDRYDVRFDDGSRCGDPASPVRLDVALLGPAPVARQPLEIGWRAGIDLNPLDLRDAEDVAWLEALVWPEHTERAERLHRAIGIARAHPVEIVRGDLVEGIEPLLARVPPGLRTVVFHTAVLAYLPTERREAFARIMAAHPEVTWLANEGDGIVRHEDGALEVGRPNPDSPAWSGSPAPFVLVRDGRPVALTQAHGEWIEYL